MCKTLLVPVDGSYSSVSALKFALSMLNDGDQMFVLNVQKPQFEGFQSFHQVSKEELEQYYLKKGKEIIQKVLEEVPQLVDKVERIVKLGLPAIEITRLAKERNVYSIIMGSKGNSQVVNNALGSVTYSVLHLATCPVTIVPNDKERDL